MSRVSIIRVAAILVASALITVTAQAATLRATLLTVADDPRLERNRLEPGYLGHPGGPALDAVRMALAESGFELDAAGAAIALTSASATSSAGARAAAQKAEKAGAAMLLVDLPSDWTRTVAAAVKVPVINLGNASDNLRERDCTANLWHVLPSERMRTDALAQTLISRKWKDVLLLTGPTALDGERSRAAQASIKRYGLKLVASKPFKLSADPRERALANPLLLTGGNYDVVWVVDSDGEFARSLPYRTVRPRPVVGDAGLVALAWQAHFERFGAPQIVRHFAKLQKREMTAHDWAAWLAGRALVAAAVAAPKGPASAWAKALANNDLDGSKGVSLNFRPWDGQLRQPLLLTDGQGVIGMAPLDGILHPRNALDTLGADAPEKLCPARR